MGLEFLWVWVFYKYFVPTALGFTSNALSPDRGHGPQRLVLGAEQMFQRLFLERFEEFFVELGFPV